MNIAIGSLALATLVGAAALGVALFGPLPNEVATVAPGQRAVVSTSRDTLSSAVWAERAPFRRDRRPSAVGYDARRLLAAASAAAAPPRPQLLLRGVVGGTEPAAIVEGLPGSDGPRVVRVGERLGELMVRRIAASRVVISGMDTAWSLELPRTDP